MVNWTEKKEYRAPILRTVEIKLGVFGCYGEDDPSGRKNRGHLSNQGGWDGPGGGPFGGD